VKLFDWLPDSREIMCVWRPVTNKKLYQDGHQSHAKIACHWRPVTLKMYPSGSQWYVTCTRVAASCSQITVNFIHFSYNWWQHRHNLHVAGGRSGTILMWLVTSRMQFLHALATSSVQRCLYLRAHSQNNYLN
jgi:hypothetical protein